MRRGINLLPENLLGPLAELDREFVHRDHNPLHDLTCAGISIYYAVLENI